jgi:hypothetical protein
LIAELLSLPNAATDLNLSPQRKRETLFETLLNEMEALSRRRPVLAMFEDAHWIDPTFEKYDFDVLLLEGSYVSDPNVRRAVIKDGNDRCSVEEYASRYFRGQGYSALRVENEPISALFGVFMSPLIQDALYFCSGQPTHLCSGGKVKGRCRKATPPLPRLPRRIVGHP